MIVFVYAYTCWYAYLSVARERNRERTGFLRRNHTLANRGFNTFRVCGVLVSIANFEVESGPYSSNVRQSKR